MKIVYLWKNGTPVIIYKNEDGEFVYPVEKTTENNPPPGIYQPYYYDGNQWIGNTEESYKAML
ncbi:hypothetical protein M3559_03615 [Staphylococcus equorum]|uniref:hypothetical protein n=1 Tax=Staphylococcus equorum TaxID=246432 RepID=UPI00203ACF88|nr:hypothetical protein [Staphylococcus equorum]MCM3071740.1 hypothetical protein [Staphylococcus equorum]